MKIKRREFLAGSIAGIGTFLLGSKNVFSAEPNSSMYDPFETVTLGKTGIKVSRIGLGTGMRGGNRQSNHTRMGQDKFDLLAKGCYERGVRLFDVADLYGTHPFLMQAMQKMQRRDYVIVSKIWFRRGGLPEPERPSSDIIVERFLKELNTDYIDMILLHCVTSPNWTDELSDQMNVLDKLKKKGIIRAHGISCHSLAALEKCISEPWIDSVHVRLNPYAVSMDVNTIEEIPKVETAVKTMRKQGKAIIGMKIIGEGRFRNSDEKRDKSIKYAFESGCMDSMVVGFEKIEEIDDFASRVKKIQREDKQNQVYICPSTQVA